ncbi:hypothetical protein RRG08_012592 [Elysia crispata]|uniref:Uncharacterized protein n=1 Tax=Elysia crispata TaxID=231223 RepID=A0AAE1DZF9_9GAST|nr:hypothetical protein RRG08_012592 [Elysia crispata]
MAVLVKGEVYTFMAFPQSDDVKFQIGGNGHPVRLGLIPFILSLISLDQKECKENLANYRTYKKFYRCQTDLTFCRWLNHRVSYAIVNTSLSWHLFPSQSWSKNPRASCVQHTVTSCHFDHDMVELTRRGLEHTTYTINSVTIQHATLMTDGFMHGNAVPRTDDSSHMHIPYKRYPVLYNQASPITGISGTRSCNIKPFLGTAPVTSSLSYYSTWPVPLRRAKSRDWIDNRYFTARLSGMAGETVRSGHRTHGEGNRNTTDYTDRNRGGNCVSSCPS